MLRIKDPKNKDPLDRGVEVVDFHTASAMLAASVDPPAKSGQVTSKLLDIVTLAAISDVTETYTEQDVAYAYRKLYGFAEARLARTEECRSTCQTYLPSADNRDKMRSLSRAYKAQQSKLGTLETAEFVIITRGTDPVQARNIMAEETFGGVEAGPVQTGAPTAASAERQTGYGEKASAEGLIEEWSLGMQEGFATNGFMLMAAVSPALVRLPPVEARSAGEQGACGFADRRLLCVAIDHEGRRSKDIDPLVREIEGIIKSDVRTGAALAALQQSALLRVT